MTDQQKAALADRLATGAASGPSRPRPSGNGDLTTALERMLGAGADRFGLRADGAGDACALAPPLAPSSGVPDVLVGSCWPAIFAVIGAASTRAQSPTQADRAIDIVEGLLDLVHLDHGIVTHAALPERSEEMRISAKARGVRDTELGRVIDVTVEIASAHDGARLATLRERFAIRGRTGWAEAGEPNRFGGALDPCHVR